MRNRLILIIAGVAGALSLHAADPDVSKLPKAAAKEGVTYAKDIQPLFEKNCIKCHGPEKQKAKYRIDSLPAVIKGGDSDEAAVVPGKSDKSPLVHYIGYLVEDMEMPPKDKDGKSKKLKDEEIA